MRVTFPLHTYISCLFLAVILVISGLIGGLGYVQSRDALQAGATDLTQRVYRETGGTLQRLLSPAEMAVNLLTQSDVTDGSTLTERWKRLSLICAALRDSTAVTQLYVGYDSGDFFAVQNVPNDEARALFKAPDKTRFIVRSIEHGASPPKGRLLYLDDDLQILSDENQPSYAASFDPRARSWYAQARYTDALIRTQPYLFFSNQKVGTTLAKRARNGQAVVGADILLETFGDVLAQQKITPGTHIALVNADGYVIGYEDSSKLFDLPKNPESGPSLKRLDAFGVPVLDDLGELLAGMNGSDSVSTQMQVDQDTWRIFITPLSLQNSQPIYLVICIPESELLKAALDLRSNTGLIALLCLALAIPLTWAIARTVARPLRQLAAEANSILKFEFSNPLDVRSAIAEVNEVGITMNVMKRAIRRFLDTSRAVSSEPSFERLLPMLLREMIAASEADVGVLYLADDGRLNPAAGMKRNLSNLSAPLPSVSLAHPGPVVGTALDLHKAYWGCLNHRDFECLGLTDAFLSETDARIAVAVPLLNRQQQLVGLILLLRLLPIEDEQMSFLTALSGSAASSLEARDLIKEQRDLFEAFIQLIAVAIDAKSAHTAGHCARVPELTKMLAQAACDQTEGPYKDFRLDDKEWEAVHVAAWLHDCGKVTTPEYVIDKATKLETIYDRIHEIRMRFEVLKRDSQIACLQAMAAGEESSAAQARLATELDRLDDDFAFVARCNEGSESLAPEDVARLRALAQRTWLRTLDDRIGISHEEKERKDRAAKPTLPVHEPLLADQPDQTFDRRPQERLAPDNRWGFHMDVPELLYNKGELHNLTIGRGTLSEEERYKINEHIVQTIIMLSQLPFPKHLRQVPEIAAGHHEKMDGTGYPKRLSKDQMSPLARMVAIADIFEALTAVDRPYKKGKTLSAAVEIMARMKDEHHIDPDLFALFLRSGIYRSYAERFMKLDQIDDVAIERYL